MKKMLALLLTLCLLAGMVPLGAGATEDTSCEDGTECTHAAAIGDTHYATLAEALNAAKDGDTVKLLDNTTIGEPATIDDGNIVFDMNGKKVSYIPSKSNDALGIIDIAGTANVTVTGNGSFDYTDDYYNSSYNEYGYIFRVAGNANLAIENGNFHAVLTCVQVGSKDPNNVATAIIKGGTYTADVEWSDKYWHLNLIDYDTEKPEEDKPDKIIVTGGTFVNYDPSHSGTEKPVANFVAEGYTVVQNEDKFVVEKLDATNAVAQVGEDSYFDSLSAAITAATENATVKLLKDTAENVTISQGKTLTLDLNGKTLTGTVEVSGALIIQDSTVTGEPTVSSDYENVTYTSGKITSSGTTVKATNGGTVTLKSGLLESTGNIALFAAGDSTGSTEVKSTVNVDGGYILSQEFAVSTQGKGATANISGGVLVAKDNAVVAGNGTNNATTKYGGTIINITGGMLIGHITTPDYIACGIYHPQQGQLNISGGTIYADEGLGILMRGGKLDMTGGKIFATANERATGKVGDSKVLVGGSAVLYDLQSGYYDGNNVEITLKGGEFSSSANVPIVSVSADENSLAEAGKRVSISGGYFTSDPSDYVATGYYAGESDNAAYAYKVKPGGNEDTPAEVVAAEPDVKAAPGIDNTVTTALSGTTADLTAAANEQAANNKVTENDAKEALDGIYQQGDTVTVVVQPYLAMEAKSYDSTNSTMTVDIKAMYRTVATTAKLDGENPEKIIVSGEAEANETANAVVIGKKENALPVEGSVEISIPLPTGFVTSAEKKVYVQHKNTYEYEATVTETGTDPNKTYTATFTNPHGFSTFGLSTKSETVATVNGTNYTNFQQAVNATVPNGTIEVKANGQTATGVTHSLTLKNGDNTQPITVTINGKTIMIPAGGTETFTYTAPTPPRPTEEKHSITISTDGKGQVTGPASAAEDDKVTLTVKPNADKELYDLKVTDEDGKAVTVTKVNDTTYTFTMPDGKVTVAATFGCDGGDNCPSKAFTDLGDKQWYHDFIDYAVENGLLEGTSATTMEPNATLIRAQLAQILYNIEDKPAVTGEMVFEDVPASEWFYSPVLWANQNEIINGTSPTTFEPLEAITRQDLALMLYRYAGKPAVTGDLDGFTDGDQVGDWAEEAMAWAVAEGIVQGDTPTTLNPTGTATRAEAAAMLQRFLEDAA